MKFQGFGVVRTDLNARGWDLGCMMDCRGEKFHLLQHPGGERMVSSAAANSFNSCRHRARWPQIQNLVADPTRCGDPTRQTRVMEHDYEENEMRMRPPMGGAGERILLPVGIHTQTCQNGFGGETAKPLPVGVHRVVRKNCSVTHQ
jgi:hypothetical protein